MDTTDADDHELTLLKTMTLVATSTMEMETRLRNRIETRMTMKATVAMVLDQKLVRYATISSTCTFTNAAIWVLSTPCTGLQQQA